jgi:hypothetical protein
VIGVGNGDPSRANSESYVPESFSDPQLYHLFLVSVVPLLIVYCGQLIVATMLLSVRTWDMTLRTPTSDSSPQSQNVAQGCPGWRVELGWSTSQPRRTAMWQERRIRCQLAPVFGIVSPLFFVQRKRCSQSSKVNCITTGEPSG